VSQQIEGAGAAQVAAARDFLESLSPQQREQAVFPFDSKERFNWNFIPLQDKDRKATRKGLPLESMTAEQKRKAIQLLKTGSSERGAETARLIMSLESILRESEKMGAMVRNPEWYFVSIFGAPNKTGQWGWRFEGHHLSINMTLDGTQVIASSPFFFGANPATIKVGAKQGQKVLPEAQDLAVQLFASLDAGQKTLALREKQFPEPGQKELSPKVGAAVGLPAAQMNEAQKALLWQLVVEYASRKPKDLGQADLDEAREAGVDRIHFAYSGSAEEGKGRSYRIHGPTLLIEFLNIQADGHGNPNNHIHSSHRRIAGDFGVRQPR
jgi:hypothetical protein